jgi:putative transposase
MNTPARKRYPSDLTDLQGANSEHLVPQGDGTTGRPRKYPLREVVHAALYWARAGCTWRMLPPDFPPCKTVSSYFYTWRDAGVWEHVHAALRSELRATAGREPTPVPASWTARRSRPPRLAAPRGTTGGKKVAGRKRHLLVDTLGLVGGLAVLPADVPDWDGAKEVLKRVGKALPRLARV